MRLKISLLLALILASCIQISPEEVLGRAYETYKNATGYSAEVMQVVNGVEKGNFSIYFRKNEVLKMVDEKTVTIVKDNKMIVYNRTSGEKVLETNVSKIFDLYGYLLNLVLNGNSSIVGEDKVEGKSCFVLSSDAKTENIRIEKIWISKDWKILKAKLKFNFKLPNRTIENTVVVEFRNLEFFHD